MEGGGRCAGGRWTFSFQVSSFYTIPVLLLIVPFVLLPASVLVQFAYISVFTTTSFRWKKKGRKKKLIKPAPTSAQCAVSLIGRASQELLLPLDKTRCELIKCWSALRERERESDERKEEAIHHTGPVRGLP